MSFILPLNHAVPIPVGHTVEVTEYADTRPEKKRKGWDLSEAFRHPVVLDLDTGIRYMNHVHASRAGNGGNSFAANPYPLTRAPTSSSAASTGPGSPPARSSRSRAWTPSTRPSPWNGWTDGRPASSA